MMRLLRIARYLRNVAVCIVLAAIFFASPTSAADRDALAKVFALRVDLQALFDGTTWKALDLPQTKGIVDLEDWAKKYGYREHEALASFAPEYSSSLPDGFLPEQLDASVAFVIRDDGEVLFSYGNEKMFSPGSATKLMTAIVVLEQGIDGEKVVALVNSDKVGGLSLDGSVGEMLRVEDLMSAMLVGSANDATMALVRSTGLSRIEFVERMNLLAEKMGMKSTVFTGPTGMETDATTNAHDLALLVRKSLTYSVIRKMTTTMTTTIRTSRKTYTVASPNQLLTNLNNDLFVLGGKNGYVDGSGWGVAVRMMDVKKKDPVIVVVSGSSTKEASFRDARVVAEWVWYGELKNGENVRSSISPEVRKALSSIYKKRRDLQELFDPVTWKAKSSSKTVGISNLVAWASRYGYKEHTELHAFFPESSSSSIFPARREETRIVSLPPALAIDETAMVPVHTGRGFDFSQISAEKVVVVDMASRRILFEKNATSPHHMASITKLMTALVVRENHISMSKSMTLLSSDERGGARLRVRSGTSLTVGDLMYAMLVGSANNAAHALLRSTGMEDQSFVEEMNRKAKSLGLLQTSFSGPSGLDLGNRSTAKDIAALAIEAFKDPNIRMMASTAKRRIWTSEGIHTLRNTNALLTDPNNGLVVLGGKTGYLIESKWNLVVHLMDSRRKPLLVVVLGSSTRRDSFRDAELLARWSWDNYSWR